MQRTPVNSWDRSLSLGCNQVEIVDGATHRLVYAGQTATDAGGAPQHPGDMKAPMALALDNLEAVLKGAGMGLADVVRLGVYVTDMDVAVASFGELGSRFGPSGNMRPMTLSGVTRLAVPDLMFEIEAEALA